MVAVGHTRNTWPQFCFTFCYLPATSSTRRHNNYVIISLFCLTRSIRFGIFNMIEIYSISFGLNCLLRIVQESIPHFTEMTNQSAHSRIRAATHFLANSRTKRTNDSFNSLPNPIGITGAFTRCKRSHSSIKAVLPHRSQQLHMPHTP